jgi:hypothetical protein
VDLAKLVGWIQWSGDIDDGLDKLDQFDEEWFLDHHIEVNNKSNFNIEN